MHGLDFDEVFFVLAEGQAELLRVLDLCTSFTDSHRALVLGLQFALGKGSHLSWI